MANIMLLAIAPVMAIGLGQCQGHLPEESVPQPRSTGFSVAPSDPRFQPNNVPISGNSALKGQPIEVGLHRVDVRARWGRPDYHSPTQDFYPVGNGAYTVVTYDPETLRVTAIDYKGVF